MSDPGKGTSYHLTSPHLNNSEFDVYVMIIFGIIGYLFRKFEYEAAPLLLAFVLGPLLDLNLRHALLASDGRFLDFFTRPISAVTLSLSVLLLLTAALPAVMKRLKQYRESVQEE